MKNKPISELVKRLMQDGVLRAKTPIGAYQVLHYHLRNGNLKLRYVDGKHKKWLWAEREYNRIVRDLKLILNRG